MRKITLAVILLAAAFVLSACDAPAGPPVLITPSAARAVAAPALPISPSPPAGSPGREPVTPLAAPAANALANLRSGPGTAFPVVGSARPGQPLQIVARNAAGDWLQLAGGEWIFAELVSGVAGLTAGATGAPPTGPPVPPAARTTGSQQGQARAGAGLVVVTVIDVGQGDSILIQTPDGHAALVDAGMPGTGALQYLQRNGIDRLDLVVGTHAHADHIGGLSEVLQSIPAAEVATNGQGLATPEYEAFLRAARAAGARIIEVKRGDRLPLGNLALEVLSPAGARPAGDPNHNSLVLRFDYGATSFQFEADADQAAEEEMLAAGVLRRVTFLKVGHHGGSTSSSPGFLAELRPAVAAYSAMPFNPYGYPHRETMANLGTVGAEVHGTDREGSITVTSDGATYRVTIERAGEPAAVP